MLILEKGKLIRKKSNKLNKSNNESAANKLNYIISKSKSSKQDFWDFVYNVWNKINDKDIVDDTSDDEVRKQQEPVKPAISPTDVAASTKEQLS